MRLFAPVFVLLAAQLVAHAAPHKAARKATGARLKATPLSPEKLRGQLAYVHSGNLWVIHPDTRQKRLIFSGDVTTRIPNRIAHFNYSAREFSLSPDLKNLVANVSYDGSINGTSELYVFPVDGKVGRRLTFDKWAFSKASPRWSPDGKHIAYTRHTSYIAGGGPAFSKEVRVIDVDGSNNRLVAGTINPQGPAAFEAFWSHDSKRLLFTFFNGALDWENDIPTQRERATAAIDGPNRQPFDGNWTVFQMPEVAREAKVRAEFISSSRLVPDPRSGDKIRVIQLFSYAPSQPKKQVEGVFGEYNGFSMDGTVALDAGAKRIAFGGRISGLTLDNQGFLQFSESTPLGEWGIYAMKARGRRPGDKPPRLLVTNAQLVGWL